MRASQAKVFVADSTLVTSECRDRLKQVPASMRRRLSSYSKLIVTAIMELAEREKGVHNTPVVLATRHGDLQRTEKLLRTLVQGEVLSPTQFGLSVNNAVLGQYSMAVDNQQAMTTVSGGEETYPLGWLEAIAQVSNEFERVLLVVADETPPEVYRKQQNSPIHAFAQAVLLDRENGREVILDQSRESAEHYDAYDVAEKLQHCLEQGKQRLVVNYGANSWSWHVS